MGSNRIKSQGSYLWTPPLPGMISSLDPPDPTPQDSSGAGGAGLKSGATEVIVVRHGETSWNASKILQGHLDPELNDVGRRQAFAVADRLSKEFTITAIYSSDLKRAAETAKIISINCNLPKVTLDVALRERCLGELQGLKIQEAAKKKYKAYKILLSKSMNEEIPGGGESINQLHQRCTTAIENIAKKHVGERVLVVTHGGVIRELHQRADHGIRPGHGGIPNTSVTLLHISDHGRGWKITSWADVSHLRGADFMKDSFGGDGTSG